MAPTTPPGIVRPTIIGYEADGTPVWSASGARSNLGISFEVDDGDEDDPDAFDDEPDDDTDEAEEAPRGKRHTRRRAETDELDDDEPDDDTDEADEPDEEDPEDWEPPTREQWERMEAAHRRNNGELMKRRLAAKALKRLNIGDDESLEEWLISRGIDPESGEFLEPRSDDDTENRTRTVQDAKRAEQRGAARTEARYKPALVSFAAAAALTEAGYSGRDLARGLRLLDTSTVEVEFDENGDPVVYGLDEQVADVKKDFPELFAQRRNGARRAVDDEGDGEPAPRKRPAGTARRVGGARQVDGGERRKPAAKASGWLQQVDRAMQGLPPARR